MVRLLGLVFVGSFLTSCSPVNSEADERTIGCAILADFVAREFSGGERPLFLSNDPTPSTPPDKYQDIDLLAKLVRSSTENPPPIEEVRSNLEKQERLSELSPTAECDAVARIKQEKSFEPPPQKADLPETTDDGLFYLYDSLAVQIPLVDVKRGDATFEIARVCGPLCAGGTIVLYKKNQAGEWVFDSETGTWIS